MAGEQVHPLTPTSVLELLPAFPIVLVSTRSNVLTINQLAYFTFTPLTIGIGLAHVRYSYSLLKSEGEFVINIPDASLIEAVKICGSLSGRDADKFARAGLTPQPSLRVEAVSIRQCWAHIECRVEREPAFDERTWFIGRVVAARKAPDHEGAKSLLYGRHDYVLPGEAIAPR